jgi:hypothetical protein
MKRDFPVVVLTVVVGVLFSPRGVAAAASPCQADPAFHRLDFWIGDWDVYDSPGGRKAGRSVSKKILQGCAISVDWNEADGSGEIQETYFYEKARKTWHQVWISDAGLAKERLSIEDGPGGALRFLGEVLQLDGRSYLDRSTVTPVHDGRVHQVIDISRDRGSTWRTVFDGEYRRRPPGGDASSR